MAFDPKKYFTVTLAKKLGKVVYLEVVKPAAEEMVKSTATPLDDLFLTNLEVFADKFFEGV